MLEKFGGHKHIHKFKKSIDSKSILAENHLSKKIIYLSQIRPAPAFNIFY